MHPDWQGQFRSWFTFTAMFSIVVTPHAVAGQHGVCHPGTVQEALQAGQADLDP